jgi:hypothetical protein
MYANRLSSEGNPTESYSDAYRAASFAMKTLQIWATYLDVLLSFESPESCDPEQITVRSTSKEISTKTPGLTMYKILRYRFEADLYDDDPITWCMFKRNSSCV